MLIRKLTNLYRVMSFLIIDASSQELRNDDEVNDCTIHR